jgi:hypothetical protein
MREIRVEYSERAKKYAFAVTMTPARFQRMLSQQSRAMANDILAMSKENESQREAYRRLRNDIRDENAEAWDYFDAVIYSMQQNGLLMLRRMDDVGEDGHSDSRTALSLIHGSATLILFEIRTLLLEGLWAGGAARWRALHELTVTATVVARGGSGIARRYLDHGFVVQTERFARFYARHARGPISEATLRQRQIRSQLIIQRSTLPNQQGSFKDQYGWAAPLMAFDRTAMTLHGDGVYAFGPVNAFTSTVARPSLLSIIHCIGATHLGFEDDINETAQLLGLLASGAMDLASRGVESFPVEDQPANDQT